MSRRQMHQNEVLTDADLVHLPLTIPVVVVRGEPGHDYPFDWLIYEWLPDENAHGKITDLEQASTDLAGFISSLRRIPTDNSLARPPSARGAPLAELDDQVRRSIGRLGSRVDGAAATRV